MSDQIEVTPSGEQFAAASSAEIRQELHALIDALDPAALLIAWATLQDSTDGKKSV